MTPAVAPRVLVARLDAMGDVLLAGPAVRAVAAQAEVTMACGRRGRQAADLLPGVAAVIPFTAPWIEPEPAAVSRRGVDAFVADVAQRQFDAAMILTSFHQDPLPLALLLRLAGVARIGAVCDDYPGSLLDVRHHVTASCHEVERACSLAEAMGFSIAAGDDQRLAVREDRLGVPAPLRPGHVVVHPGASVSARAWDAAAFAKVVDVLVAAGRQVVVTGGPDERDLTALVAGPARPDVVDLGGATDMAGLAAVMRGAAVVIAANTGPAHLAAAVGTPIVSVFAPTVPAEQWRPWGVPTVVLGQQDIGCAGCRARECPVPGHPCVSSVSPAAVVAAVFDLLERRSMTGLAGPFRADAPLVGGGQ